MKKMRLLTKKDLYEDIRKLDENVLIQEKEIGRLNENLADVRSDKRNLLDNLEDIYYLLKQIEKLTKNSTIKTLSILKRNEIKNISGIYIGDDE